MTSADEPYRSREDVTATSVVARDEPLLLTLDNSRHLVESLRGLAAKQEEKIREALTIVGRIVLQPETDLSPDEQRGVISSIVGAVSSPEGSAFWTGTSRVIATLPWQLHDRPESAFNVLYCRSGYQTIIDDSGFDQDALSSGALEEIDEFITEFAEGIVFATSQLLWPPRHSWWAIVPGTRQTPAE